MTITQVVQVQRKKLAACMTCPLCNKLFRDATTISECLHTFCRNCIYVKIMEEYSDRCPVCNIDLGCAPLEKLRADNSMQDLIYKIFPQENKPEAEVSIPLPIRRKERSLSSLGINTARKSSQLGVNARRAKSYARKNIALRKPIISVDEYNTANEKEKKDHVETANLSQKPSVGNESTPPKHDPPNQPVLKEVYDIAESCVEKSDSWKSLNSLADIAASSRFGKTIVEDDIVEIVPEEPQQNEAQNPRIKRKGRGFRYKSFMDDNGQAPETPDPLKRRRLKAIRKKRADKTKILTIPAQAAVDMSSKSDTKYCPMWFSLNACDNKEGYAPLQQIPSCCLRIRDGNIPVTFIQKYLAQKLDLASEAEVQIFLRGEPMPPTLRLNQIVDYWLQSVTPSERVQTSVGSSGMEFVMPLSYARNRRSTC